MEEKKTTLKILCQVHHFKHKSVARKYRATKRVWYYKLVKRIEKPTFVFVPPKEFGIINL